jgi:hypothetical protein
MPGNAFKPRIESDGITMAEFLKEHHNRHIQSKKESTERWDQMATITLPDNFNFDELLAGARKKGQYLDVAQEFLNSEVNGVEVDLTNGEFKGKKVMTVVQGFKNAIEKHKLTNLRVIANDDRVFLINTDLV